MSKMHSDSPMTIPSLCELSSADSSFLDDSASVNVSIGSFDGGVPKQTTKDDTALNTRVSKPKCVKETIDESVENGTSHTRNNSLYSIGDLPPLCIPPRPIEVQKGRSNSQIPKDSKDTTTQRDDIGTHIESSKIAADRSLVLGRKNEDSKQPTPEDSPSSIRKKQGAPSSDDVITSLSETRNEKFKSENIKTDEKEFTFQVLTLPAKISRQSQFIKQSTEDLDFDRADREGLTEDGDEHNKDQIAAELIKKLKVLETKDKENCQNNQHREGDIENKVVDGGEVVDISAYSGSSLEDKLQESIAREKLLQEEINRMRAKMEEDKIKMKKEMRAKEIMQAEVSCLDSLSSSQQETISFQQKTIRRFEEQVKLLQTSASSDVAGERQSYEREEEKNTEAECMGTRPDELAKTSKKLVEIERREVLMQKYIDNLKEESNIFAEQVLESEKRINMLKADLQEKETKNESLRTELQETKEKLYNLETRANSLSVLQSNISKLENSITSQNAASETLSKTNETIKKEKDEMECHLRDRIHELEIKITRMTKVSVAQELRLSGKNLEIEKLKVLHISEITLLDQDRETLTNRLEEKDAEVAKLKDRLRAFNESNVSLGSDGSNENFLPREFSRNLNVGDKDEWKRAVSDSVNASVNFLNGLSEAAGRAKCAHHR